MFTPRALGPNASRSKASQFTSSKLGGTPAKTRRRTSNIFARGTTSFSNSFRNESLNRSLQAPVPRLPEEITQLEEFGGPLPISVTEALTLSDRNVKISSKLDSSGWAWLICGRKLLVWHYKPSSQVTKSSACKELMLPSSHLPTSHPLADLTVVVPVAGGPSQWPTCVTVTPGAVVRVWCDVSQEAACCELACELGVGDECVRVMSLGMETRHDMEKVFSCIIATRNSHMILLTVSVTHNSVKYRHLKAPKSLLSGIGRRMSSFIFGSGGAPGVNAALHQILPGERLSSDSRSFYVLSGNSLQKWSLDSDVAEQFIYQCDVEQFMRQCLAETVWGQETSHLENLKIWVLDMQMTRDGVVILGAGVNTDVSNQVHYALGTLHTIGIDSPQSFLSFTVSKFTERYQEENESPLLSYKLLLPDPRISSAYLYHSKVVICLSVSSSNDPLDKVEFQSPGDRLIGAGDCEGMAIFFSMVHGLVSVRCVDTKADTSMLESMLDTSVVAGDTSLMCNAARLNELSMSEDRTARLKAAFLHHCSGNKGDAVGIIEDLFPPGSQQLDPLLDQLVYKLCHEMADEFPASDPRWAESVRQGGTSTSGSLILIHQLTDKLKAHNYFVQFLKSCNLWQRLSSLGSGSEQPGCTRLLMLELAEKLIAARTLREIHAHHSGTVDATIRRLMESRQFSEAAVSSGLTPQDLFYREVSRIEEFFDSLLGYEQETLETEISVKQTITLVSTVNTILTSMIFAAWQYRQSNTSTYEQDGQLTVSTNQTPYFVPWTSSTGTMGVRILLCTQHELTVSKLSLTEDTHDRGGLLQQLVELTDIVLDSYRPHLEFLATDSAPYAEVRTEYERARTRLITPFLKEEQYERAASLAEKYCDFSVLVQLCEKTDNQDRLQRYLTKFQNQGFSDFVFRWYMKEGKRGKLMSSQLANHPQLGNFLQTSENRFLSWVHNINNGEFHQAHLTLHALAKEEKKFLSKKKTLLSLSKLSALATEDPLDSIHVQLESINDEQDLILHQEQLPPEVAEALGEEVDKMRVLSAEELIELYIGEYNVKANEFDFKKALDLLHFLDKTDENRQSLLVHIWCRAILMDSWSDMSTEDPLEGSTNTIFLKTLELAYLEGMNLLEVLPSVDQMLAAEELGTLRQNTTFQFILKAGYEHVQRVLS